MTKAKFEIGETEKRFIIGYPDWFLKTITIERSLKYSNKLNNKSAENQSMRQSSFATDSLLGEIWFEEYSIC